MRQTLPFLFLLASLTAQSQNWTSAFVAGQNDVNSKYIGGTETMTLTSHKGKLYAAMSYVSDLNNTTYAISGGTPILILDSANSQWKQDILFDEIPLVPSMKEIIFTKDFSGSSIAPDTLLIAGPNNKYKHIFIYTKNDATDNWIKDSITTVTDKVEIRSIVVHYDLVTGHQYVLIGVSDFGIWKGEYNGSLPSKIQWETIPEYVIPSDTRVLGFADVNGVLYSATTEASTGVSKIFRRTDGSAPAYTQIWADSTDGVADVRGLTPVVNASGTSFDLWFYWNNHFKRLEPQNGDAVIDELNVSSDLSQQSGRVFSDEITAAFNDNQPFWKDPATNDTLMLIGFQAKYDSAWLSSNPYPNIAGRSTDGMYYSRMQNGSVITYQLHYIVNNTPIETDTLLATRTICISPFATDSNKVLYAGGFNGNGIPTNNTAWIYKGTFSTFPTFVAGANHQNSSISVFPNPAQKSFTIDLAGEHFDLIICDLAGKKVYEQKKSFGKAEIDCEDFPNGIYFIHLTTDKQAIYNHKIIVSN